MDSITAPPVVATPAPITIQGIRFDSIKVDREEGTGEDKISGSYSLISSTGRTLAKQSVGEYGMKIAPSPATLKAFAAAIAAYKNDVNITLGLA